MKVFPPLLVIAVLLPAWAAAQVMVNPAALSQLAGVRLPPPAETQAQPAAMRHIAHHRKPIIAVAQRLPLPPAPAPMPAPAPAVARLSPTPLPPPLPAPIGIKFAAGSSGLPASAATALQPFCRSTRILSIEARAPGDGSDPSDAMRLSLARALAVRDALAACGVPSRNILPRALGAMPGRDEDETMLGIATK